MYHSLEQVTLSNGDRVEAGVVLGPDEAWAGRVESLLGHKDGQWRTHIVAALREACGLATRFYLLHRGGAPIANVMLVERGAAAILGHVFTVPEERRRGASSHLLGTILADARSRGLRAIYLGTEFDSPPYHLYRRFGFEGLEPGSGVMTWCPEGLAAFEASYLDPSDPKDSAFDWPHWPAAAPLLAAAAPSAARLPAFGVVSRQHGEDPVLKLLCATRASPPAAAARVLEGASTGAVLALAARRPDPLWPQTELVDVFCHASLWRSAPELLASLGNAAERQISYAEADDRSKLDALRASGFAAAGVLPSLLRSSEMGVGRRDVVICVKSA